MSAGLMGLLLVLNAAPLTVASPAWTTVQVPADLADFYGEHLATALRRQGLKVMTSRDITALLSMERQKQLLGCSEDAASCMAELGAALGCDALLLVNLARLEDSYQGTLKLVKSTDASVLAETRVEASGQKALLAELDSAAERLAQGLSAPAPGATGVRTSAGGARRFWWIPAVVAGVGATMAVVGLVGASQQYAALQTELDNRGATPAAADYAATGTTLQTIGWVGVGVGGAALVSLGALLLFGDAPVQPQVTLAPGAVTLGVTWRWP